MILNDLCGFHGFGNVLGEKFRQPVAACGTGLDGSHGPIRSLQSCDLYISMTDDSMI